MIAKPELMRLQERTDMIIHPAHKNKKMMLKTPTELNISRYNSALQLSLKMNA